jgi:hypothetical protein
MILANSLDASASGYQSQTSTGVWNGRTFQATGGITLINPDGTGGNTTIVGGAGSPSVNSVLDGFDDFINEGAASALTFGDTPWALASGATIPSASIIVAGHPGIVSSKTTGYFGLFKGYVAGPTGTLQLGGGVLTVTFYFRINSLTTYTVSMGLTDVPEPGADAVNGVYLIGQNGVNSGNWQGKTATASTITTANSSTAVTTAWTVAQIVVNAAATSASFYIGTTLANLAQIANSPISTNIPTSAKLGINWGVANAGSGTVDLDLVTWNYALTTAR